MNELNLDNLSNKEIQDLWAKTTTEAKRQHGAKLEAQLQSSDIANDDYYIDNFGNAIEGKPPAPKSGGEYCDERGYMQTLEPGEKPPLPTNNRQHEHLRANVGTARRLNVRPRKCGGHVAHQRTLDLRRLLGDRLGLRKPDRRAGIKQQRSHVSLSRPNPDRPDRSDPFRERSERVPSTPQTSGDDLRPPRDRSPARGLPGP